MSSVQPAGFPLFFSLPGEIRRRVYEHVAASGSSNTRRDISRMGMPSVAGSSRQLREEYLQAHFDGEDIEVRLHLSGARQQTKVWLATRGDVVLNNATQITITFFDGSAFGAWVEKTVVIALGRRSVRWGRTGPRSATSGEVRVGNAHVVFNSYLGELQRNTVVARQLATATNEILASHAADTPARISPRELQQLVAVLNDIEGVRLTGLGDGWESDHVDLGVAADFWHLFD